MLGLSLALTIHCDPGDSTPQPLSPLPLLLPPLQPRPTAPPQRTPSPGSQKALERLLSLRQEGVLKSQEGKTVKLNPPRPSPRGRGWRLARTDITWEPLRPRPAAATRLLGGRALAI